MRSTRTITTSTLLLVLGCGGEMLDSSPSNSTETTGRGGNFTAGGVRASGNGVGGASYVGSPVSGGQLGSSGDLATGGFISSGGVASTGDVATTGGSSVVACTAPIATCADNCGVASNVTGHFSYLSPYRNYYMLVSFSGFAYVFISRTANSVSSLGSCPDYVPANPSDTLLCGAATFGASTSAVCGAGIVPSDCTFNAVGGIGFNLNQAQWGYGTAENGYTQPTNPISMPAVVSNVTVTFANIAKSNLRIQIAQHSADAPTYYCFGIEGMQSPLTVASSKFTTNCWDSASPGSIWDGTGLESIALIIPSQQTTPTPFDACIQNVELR
jgi:hypothetical protein